jgi:hypothetical protein
MQKLLVVALSASFIIPSAVLAGEGALKPGKPAGVRAAQADNTTWLVGIGAIGLAAGIAAAASNCCQQSNTPVPVATPSTTV